ncbi:MAG: iron transporter [Planctomycetes bacterium RBG_16_64_10]|nr:MAG: iron transporter [Planctomycetes bacterium RBG_16_64_10]
MKDPPRTLLGRLSYLGPGFVLSASIVGSGELITTTTLGAKAGFVTLWVILVSCAVKVALQLEFGRHTIQTGMPVMRMFNALPGPRLGPASWAIWTWLLLQPAKILQVGGIVGGVALILNLVVPQVTVATWAWLSATVTALLVFWERYAFIERVSLLLLGAFTLLTLASVGFLQYTPYAVRWAELAQGLRFQLPPDTVVLAIGAFGLTGVGGDEIMHYNYWLLEKGYAAYTGPYRANDPAWQGRAEGWIRVMYLDAILALVVYTTVTAAFYLLGAAVLHARGEIPNGFAMVETLATMYTETLGPWAQGVFLVGAFAVLFSTLFAALAAWTRVFSDALGRLGLTDFDDPIARRQSIAVLAWFFPLSWCAVFLYYQEPVSMVTIGGVATSMILLLVVFAALQFRYRTRSVLRPGVCYDLAFLLSVLAISVLTVYGLVALCR